MPQWSKLAIPATTGLQQQLDPMAAPAEVPISLTNAYFDKKGAIVKRPGFRQKPVTPTETGYGTTIENITGLWSAGDELCLSNVRDHFAVTSESTSGITARHIGKRSPWGGTITELWKDARNFPQCDAHAAPAGPVTFAAMSTRVEDTGALTWGHRLRSEVYGAIYGTDGQVLRQRQLLDSGFRGLAIPGGGEVLEVDISTLPHSVRAWTLNGRCCVGYMKEFTETGGLHPGQGTIYIWDADAADPSAGFTQRATITDAWHDDINMRTWDQCNYTRLQTQDTTAYHTAHITYSAVGGGPGVVRLTRWNSSHVAQYTQDISRASYTPRRVCIHSDTSLGHIFVAVLWESGAGSYDLSTYQLGDNGVLFTPLVTNNSVYTLTTTNTWVDNFGWTVEFDTPRIVLVWGVYEPDSVLAGVWNAETYAVTYDANLANANGPTRVAYNAVPHVKPWYGNETQDRDDSNRVYLSLASLNYDLYPNRKEYLFEHRGLYELVGMGDGDDLAVRFCGRHSMGYDVGLFDEFDNDADNLYMAWQPWCLRVGSCNTVSRPGADTDSRLKWQYLYGAPIRCETNDRSLSTFVRDTTHRMGSALVSLSMVAPRVNTHIARGGTMLGGAVPEWYDGATVAEQGFSVPPFPVLISADAGHGGAPAGGTAVYQTMWESADENGATHRGAPSPLLTIPTSASDAYWVYTRSNPASIRQEPIPHCTVRLYRADTSGIMRRLLHPSAATPNAHAPQDVTLILPQNERQWDDYGTNAWTPLYTEGQTYEAAPIEGCDIVHVALERVWMAGAFHRDTVYYSKRFVSGIGAYAPEFHEAFTVVVPHGDAVTGLGSIGDRVIVFTSEKCYALAGQGPLDDGSQNDFSQLVCVSPTDGCADPRSVVCTDLGVYFWDGSTIQLLDPSLQVSDIGQSVRTELASYPVLVGGAWWPEAHLVCLALQNTAGTSGLVLVYDVRWKAWSVWSINDSDGHVVVPSCITVHGGLLYVHNAANDGDVHVASLDGSHFDGKTTGDKRYVTTTIETGWVQSAGPAGWQLCRLATVYATKEANHNLTITVYTDFNATPVDTQTYAISDTNATTSIKPAVQKSQAVRFKVSDADVASPAYSGSFNFAGIVCEVAPIGHTAKLAAAKR